MRDAFRGLCYFCVCSHYCYFWNEVVFPRSSYPFFLNADKLRLFNCHNEFHIFWCRFCAISKYISKKEKEKKKNSHFIFLVFYIPIINKMHLPSLSQCHNLFYPYGL